MSDHPPYPGPPGYGGGGYPGYGPPPAIPGIPGIPGQPGPPPRDNRLIVIALIVAVVVVAGGITIAILLTGGHGSTVQSQSSQSSPRPSGTTSHTTSTTPSSSPPASTPVPTATESTPATATGAGNVYFAAFRDHDLARLKQLACPTSSIKLTQATLDAITSATSNGPADVSDGTATMTGTFTGSDGSVATVTVFLTDLDGSWCLDHTKAS